MAGRRRNRGFDDAEAIAKAVGGIILLLALGMGGITGFGRALTEIMFLLVVAGVGVGLLLLVVYIGIKVFRAITMRARTTPTSVHGGQFLHQQPLSPEHRTGATFPIEQLGGAAWNAISIRQKLEQIDWYQFEKFCAALLQADGFQVQRKGGATPDGGVDLIVEKSGARKLIQCKHWRTWVVQEKVVRELLGSMTHFGVRHGAIYTLKGWTEPAARFAAQHEITLVNGDTLAASAGQQLPSESLRALLDTSVHHCPKCEKPMVWRQGNFTPFWGCSNYPRCRGKLNQSGAR